MKIRKISVIIIGISLIIIGYAISFFSPHNKELKIIVPHNKEERNIYINIQLNKTYLPVSWGMANWIKSELMRIKKPYKKSVIDSLIRGLNAACFVDSNKCGVFLVGSSIDNKVNVWEDFYITPDTIYLIDNYRPVLFKYLKKNVNGSFDTLDIKH